MPLRDLSEKEKSIVYNCLEGAADGPFFPDWEFQTLFGLTRTEFRKILGNWPLEDEKSEAARSAINHSFNNLLGYPHGLENRIHQLIGSSPEKIEKVFNKWKKSFAPPE